MAKAFPFYDIIITRHFCRRMAIYGSFLEQDIRKASRSLKMFNDLQILLKAEMGQGIVMKLYPFYGWGMMATMVIWFLPGP